MGVVIANTTSFEVSDHGTGAPVVLVHGSGGDHRTWHRQVPHFARSFRTVAYSRRYHWPNEPIPDGGKYELDQHVGDLLALLEELHLAPAHLIGHSYGGVVCLVAAMRAPHVVRSLVLEEPPVLSLFVSVPPKPAELLASVCQRPFTTAGIIKLGAFGLGPATSAARKRDFDGMVRLTGRAILGTAAYEALSEERLQQVRDNTFPEELLSEGFLPRLSQGEVKKLEVPVLLVGGRDSPFVFSSLLRELQRLWPSASRTVIDGASHLAHEDNPTQFNSRVLSFLQANV